MLINNLAEIADESAAARSAELNNAGFGTLTFQAGDGAFTLVILDSAANDESHWGGRFCNTVGHPEWITDSRIMTTATRRAALEEIVTPAVAEWAASMTKSEAAGVLRNAGLAAAPILTPVETMHEPHYVARRMFTEVEEERGARLKVVGNPIKMSGGFEELGVHTVPRIATPGEQTREILIESLGMSDSDVDNLIDKGVVAETHAPVASR